MASSGTGTFDDDDAMDWLDSFESEGASAIESALTPVAELGREEYLEAPEASHALAAAELVAAALSGEDDRLPDNFRPRLAKYVDAINDADHTALARKAVARVLRSSELKELWEDAGDEDWEDGVRDLLERLKV
jgi:hypothetical protein